MRIVGLTGGIASGKSTVAGLLEKLGARVIDADKLAREVVRPGEPAWQEIVDWLGPDILLPDRTLSRERIARLVFSDSQARSRLEAITHPAIRRCVKQAVAAAKEQGAAVVVLDIPLLFEVGWTEMMDEIWVVYVDQSTQEARLMDRDRMTLRDALARIASQMSLAEKARLATTVIDNSKDFAYTKEQVEVAWQQTMAVATTG
ncbi:MAG: dephospho-CoA kinase [Negativicutes bacterium]|nr:dephospho-CoA kinase [Negativicutes bacterium]